MAKPPVTPKDPLSRYRAKRSAHRTNEPFGAELPQSDSRARLFVCQQHGARRMHWDLRLEIDGVLRSWAIPRGPCPDPAVKRLAVQTEDHPIEYVDFEGIIPEGNYGAGAMIVWDRGVWIPLEPIDEGYRAGKLLFELRGNKLRGVWTLVRTKDQRNKDDDKNWLLIKKPDAAATTDFDFDPSSVLSGLTLEQLRDGVRRTDAIREQLRRLDPPRGSIELSTLKLMVAEAIDEPFSNPDWVFELKYDGYRLVSQRRGDQVRLQYRSGADSTHAFPELVTSLRKIPCDDFTLDAEVVVLDDDARPNFQRLQKRGLLLRRHDIARAMREHPVTLYAFDLLAFEGHDLRTLPLVHRKTLLQQLLPTLGAVRYSDHVVQHGEALYAEVQKRGLEGIVCKRAQSPYVAGRSSQWQKVRTEASDEFVIVGFTEPTGSRLGFGGLHLAIHRDGRLVHAGRVGSGLSDRELVALRKQLDELVSEQPACEFTTELDGKSHVWVEPELVCEVKFACYTDDCVLRKPVFVRMRPDKPPSECVDHRRKPTDDVPPPAPADEPQIASSAKVTISNPDKLFWPDDGYTKADLIGFYRSIAPWLLPYLRDRPLVLTRYPDGIEGKSFFQKNAPPFVPEWIQTKTMWSEHAAREIEYFVCNDSDALAYVANLATIPLHVWGSRLGDLQHPDWCILDLDPKQAPFEAVVDIALAIRELCEEIDLPSFVKTSGSTGLHVLVPLGGQCTFEQSRTLGQIIGQVIANQLPNIATIDRSMRARKGRVYIDYVQNGHGRLLVSPFSVRPLPKAPVSTPLQWSEVHHGLDQHSLTIANVVERCERRGADPLLAVLEIRPDLQGVLANLLERLERGGR